MQVKSTVTDLARKNSKQLAVSKFGEGLKLLIVEAKSYERNVQSWIATWKILTC